MLSDICCKTFFCKTDAVRHLVCVLSPWDVVLSRRHEILNGNLYHGPDVTDGGITNMRDAGIFEPTKLIKQAVLSATEVTTALLRIDDIVGRRPVE